MFAVKMETREVQSPHPVAKHAEGWGMHYKRAPLLSKRRSLCSFVWQLPDRVEYRAIDPLHDSDGTVAMDRSLRFSAADAFDFFFDVLQRTNWQRRSFHCIQQV